MQKNTSSNTYYAPIVTAGKMHTIQLPASTDTLIGKGVSRNGVSISSYLWSLISGPNLPVITGSSSATTIISNLTAGTYIFQFMAVDSLGFTGTAKDTIIVMPAVVPVVKTLSLQPMNNPNESNITSLAPTDIANSNYSELPVQAWTNGNNFAGRVTYKFDLSSLPVNASIVSAKLTLYSNPTPINGNQGAGGNQNPNYGINNSMYIQRIVANWSPSTLTWNNQPAIETTGQVAVIHTNTGILDLVDMDVTTMVVRMQTVNNYGFKLNLQNETPYNIRNFCSSKYSDSNKHPKLVITYQ